MALHGKLHYSVCLIQCVSSSVSFYYCIVHKGWHNFLLKAVLIPGVLMIDTAQILGMSWGIWCHGSLPRLAVGVYSFKWC